MRARGEDDERVVQLRALERRVEMGPVLDDRSAHAAAELIAAERRLAGFSRVLNGLLDEFVVVIQWRVAEILERLAVECIGAATW